MKIAVIGASGGIGAALMAELISCDWVSEVHGTYYSATEAPANSVNPADHDTSNKLRVVWSKLDVTNEPATAQWFAELGAVDWIVNCVGVLHSQEHQPEKSIRQFNPDWFIQSMQVNCMPTLLLAKYSHAALKGSKQALFATVSARVGSIEDNRLGGWHSYRASKAALNMSLKCLAIEWQRTLPSARVLSLHPGTTDTPLSKPFQAKVPEKKLFSSQKTARYLLQHCRNAHEHESGRFIAWDGSPIPW